MDIPLIIWTIQYKNNDYQTPLEFLYKKQVSCLSYTDIRPVTCFNLSSHHRDNLKGITKTKDNDSQNW